MRDILLERIFIILQKLYDASSDPSGGGEYTTVLSDIKTGITDIKTLLESSEDSIFDAYLVAGEVGTVPAGYNSVTFFNDGKTNVLVNGVILPAGATRDYIAKSLQNTLPAITYNVQASKLAITGIL